MTLPAQPTGADLVTAIDAAARAAGVPILDFVRRLAKAPTSYLLQLAEAERPTAHTIARVQALVAGEPIPEARCYQLARPIGDPGSGGQLPSPVPPSAPVARDPCFRCGARGDLGCGHHRPYRPEDPWRFVRQAA